MNIFSALFIKLFGRKKPEPMPDYSERMARFDRESSRRSSAQRVGKSQGAPSQRAADPTPFSRHGDDIMSNPLHPLNPLSPISVYSDSTPAHSSSSYDCGSGSSSSYDSSSSSSSCDSSSSSSSSSSSD